MLVTCLLSEIQTDLRNPLKFGASDSELADIILEAVANKPPRHSLVSKPSGRISGQMFSIGG